MKTAKYFGDTCHLMIIPVSFRHYRESEAKGYVSLKQFRASCWCSSVPSNHGEAKDEPVVRVDAKETMQLC